MRSGVSLVTVSCVVCGVVRAGPGRSVSGVGPGEGFVPEGEVGPAVPRGGLGGRKTLKRSSELLPAVVCKSKGIRIRN